jgi:hypothetical protein
VSLLVAALLVMAGWVFAHHFLSTQRITGLVTSRLQDLYGGRVHLGQADIGLNESTVGRLELFESEAALDDPPWLEIGKVQADMPLWELLEEGAVPQRVTLTDAAITLRFDEHGHLVTRFPKAAGPTTELPAIHVHGGQVTLRQAGRGDLVLQQLHVELEQNEGRMLLKGTASHPSWGTWTLAGWADPKGGTGGIAFRAERFQLTQERLRSMPFVPLSTWQQVQFPEGQTGAEIFAQLIASETGTPELRYRIYLTPSDTKVQIASIDLSADHASGRVRIEDKAVYLSGVRGQTADGEIRMSGVLDFRAAPTKMDFRVDADKLNIKQLPRSWHLPSQIGGRLSGHADIRVSVVRGKAQPTGTGQGQITEARLHKLPLRRPIQIYLRADGGRFQFVQPPQETNGVVPPRP